ncbi:molybdenum cofactor guanylyltransferase [Actinokineospora sp. 24-640]
MTWAAIVLAGGLGTRLGGVDKPALVVGGRTLLDRALDAVDGADPVVVVGPERPVARPVRWTREAEPGAGPVAAVVAGLAVLGEADAGEVDAGEVDAGEVDLGEVDPGEVEAGEFGPGEVGTVVLLAADLPAVTAAAVARVRAAVGETGAVLVDADGRDQWLVSAWRVDVLGPAFRSPGRGLYSVLGPLEPVRVADVDGASSDVDTPADLERWR